MLEPVDLGHFFHPRRVVVVGASERPGAPTTINWRLLRRWAERAGADIVAVNPRRTEVDGLPCVRDLTDVSGPVDVVAVLVADAQGAVRDAVEIGASFVVVFSAGFAETGSDGAVQQERLAELVAGTGTRLLGPNTNLNAFEQFRDDLGGRAIALISQSGHQGRPIFLLQENGVRVGHWAPTGNEADLEAADFIAWFADQPDIGVVAAYLEGIADGRRLALAAERAVETDTPIVAVKVGRTEAGRKGVATHTGKLAGSDRVVDGAFRQFGITRVDTLDQLGDTATFLARAGRPRADGVAVYSISGGTGAHLADLFSASGLSVPRLSAETQQALHGWIPPYLSVANPIDCGGPPVGDERGRLILDTIAADPAVGVLVVAITGPFPPLSDHLAADVVAIAEDVDLPVCVIWGSPVGTEPALREVLYRSERVVVFRSARNCAAAIGQWQAWHRYRDAHRAPLVRPIVRRSRAARTAGDRAEAALGDRLEKGRLGTLSEHEAKAVLDAYGIATARSELAATAAEAVRAAKALGGHVVLKGCSPSLTHKSDLGLVEVGIEGAEAVRAAHRRLVERATAVGAPLDGVLVAEMVTGGIETVVGVSHDAVFGPVVMAGMGGVEVELLPDVVFRIPPFDRAEARRMLADLRSAARFGRVRGRGPVDVAALADLLVRVGRMAVELDGHLHELDLNPVLVRRDGQGAVALDVVLSWRR